MEINYAFDFWGNIFAIISIIVSSIVAFWIYKLTKQLSAKDKFQHEKRITKEIRKLSIYKNIILADVSKYHPLRSDDKNKTYRTQGAAIYTILPGYGVRVILRRSDEKIPVGLIPFEWIEYIRQDGDSADSKPIIVCRFKGVRWYKRFKSPFKEISYEYEKPNYKENIDPKFLKYTPFKPNSTLEK